VVRAADGAVGSRTAPGRPRISCGCLTSSKSRPRWVNTVGVRVGAARLGWLPAQGMELLRAVCAANDLVGAPTALARFYRWWDGVGVAELSQLTRTMRAWEAKSSPSTRAWAAPTGPPRRSTCWSRQHGTAGSGPRVSWVTHCAPRAEPLPEGAGRHGKDRTPRTDPPRVGRAPQHHLGGHAGT
jgi:hypothetical protein